MTPVSLADLTYEQGLQRLAMRKQALDAGLVQRMTPAALSNTLPLLKIGSSFFQKTAMDPVTQRLLIGSLGGAGLGALGGLGSAALSRDPNKSYLSRALTGAGLGGLAGGSLAAATLPGSSKETSQPKTQRAKDILKGSPDQRAADIRKLESMSSSWAPELGAGAAGLATVGGTGAALNALKNVKTFDPAEFERIVRSTNSKAFNRDVLDLSNLPKQDTLEMLTGAAPRQLSQDAWRMIKTKAGGREVGEEMLNRSMRSGLFEGLEQAVRSPAALQRFASVPKNIAGAGLLGLGGIGLGATGLNYLLNRMERGSANSTLRDLKQYINNSGNQ